MAWVLAQKDFIVPIPETTKLERLKENIKATIPIRAIPVSEYILSTFNSKSIITNSLLIIHIKIISINRLIKR